MTPGGIHESMFNYEEPKIKKGAMVLPMVPIALDHPKPKLLTLVG